MPDIRVELFAPTRTNLATLDQDEDQISRDDFFDPWASLPLQQNAAPIGSVAELLNAQVGLTNFPTAAVGLGGTTWVPVHQFGRAPLAGSCVAIIDWTGQAQGQLVHVTWQPTPEIPRNSTSTIPSALHASWLELAQSGLSNANFERLRLLSSKKEGWRAGNSKALAASSLRAFLVFWRKIREKAREPELMLTPNGALQAEWHKSHRQFLDVVFRTNGKDVNFGLFDKDVNKQQGAIFQL